MAGTVPPHMTISVESVLFADVNQMSSYENDQTTNIENKINLFIKIKNINESFSGFAYMQSI